ncbi:MAG: 16S rRNA (cytidine(1402)-2'-O)-methyltransferase, partial [Hungatella sp.]
MPLCREEDLPEAFQVLETYFNEELGYPLVINLADEYAVQYLNLPQDKYFVEEQVDSKDYLYTGDAMRTLAGKKLHKKKNHVNSFKRQYEDRVEYRALCCSDSHLVWEFLDKWREGKGDEVEEHLDYEVRGIHDILKNCSNLNIRMGGVFIDDHLEAFTMGSYNPVENMAVIHIEKANPEINGLYQYINQAFLLEEFPTVDWVNREDDLGLEGLRKSKMSYYPADFAKKYLVEQMRNGINVALVTDAGTPGISDPGEELVKQCQTAGIELTSLPGPAACITALTLSGMSTRRFCFEAFLPTDKKEKQWILEELKRETRTIIIYEAPHRLLRTLEELKEALGNRSITICRELTKKYETVFRTTFEGALDFYTAAEPKGECVIVVEGKSIRQMREEKTRSFEEMSIEEHMTQYENTGVERKEAMRLVAKDRGISKRDVYQYLMGLE